MDKENITDDDEKKRSIGVCRNTSTEIVFGINDIHTVSQIKHCPPGFENLSLRKRNSFLIS